jgi:hypothetical protein
MLKRKEESLRCSREMTEIRHFCFKNAERNLLLLLCFFVLCVVLNLSYNLFAFVAPYSAKEMGQRAMEYSHTPLWNCLLIDIGTTVTADGFLDQQVSTSAILALPQSTAPGQELFRWISHAVNSTDAAEPPILQVGYRTGNNTDIALTTFFPRSGLPPMQVSLRRGERLLRGLGTIDDVIGRNASDFSWRILGSDILDRTIRFPTAQKHVLIPDNEGKPVSIPTAAIQLMGEKYPGYTTNGAVPCYVMEAVPRSESLPNYYLSKLIYWLDQRAFFPLRIERYDQAGKLTLVTVRTASHANPQLKERGYAGFLELSWDVPRDMMTASIHTIILKDWSTEERQLFFQPESVHWQWSLPTLAQFPRLKSAEEFYLRPDLYLDKFPQERTIELSSELTARINAQEREGRLVFGRADTTPADFGKTPAERKKSTP